MARVAGRVDLDRDPHLGARERVLEREPDARLEVGAALGLRPRPPATAAAEDAAELSEQVGEVDVLVREPARARPPPPPRGPLAPNVSYCLRFSGSESVS